jgi:branched-chain amino acid transport system substrate-binding protein
MNRQVLFPVLLTAVLLTGCQHPPLPVAVLASYGGAREGAQLAADEWNAQGGVLGRRVALAVELTNLDVPSSSAEAARRAIDQGRTHYVVGDVFSVLSIRASEVTNAAKVIQITPCSTNVAVTSNGRGGTKPYVFRACFDDAEQGRMGALFAFRNLKARKAFVMVDPTNVYTRDLADSFSTSFKGLGGRIVGTESYSETAANVSDILGRIQGSKPDVVYLPSMAVEVVNMTIMGARVQGIRIPFLGGDGWDDVSLDPRAVDGSYFTTHYRPDDPTPEAQAFRKAYRAKYGLDANDIAALSFDAMNLLLTAIRTAGTDSTEAVRIALEKTSLDGITGRIVMNATHTPLKDVVVLHATGGKLVFDTSLSP